MQFTTYERNLVASLYIIMKFFVNQLVYAFEAVTTFFSEEGWWPIIIIHLMGIVINW